MTRTYRIAAIPGDGIGKEVVPEGVKALRAAADTPWRFWLTGEPSVSTYRPAASRRPRS